MHGKCITKRMVHRLRNELQLTNLDKLSRQSRFVRRKPRKIRPLEFLIAFCLMVLSGGKSLNSFATSLGLLSGETISKTAVFKRISGFFVNFLKSVLASVLLRSAKIESPSIQSHLHKNFKRVLVRDSTVISLNLKLAKYFPGSRNQTNKATASIRIQSVVDVLGEKFEYFNLTAFTKNDQSASADILEVARPGDLVMQDLGYYKLRTFGEMAEKGISFFSRHRFGVNIYGLNGKPLNLLRILKKYGRLDREVLLGEKEQVRVRLVALPLDPKVVAQRRRKAKNNRDKRTNPSKNHLALMGWAIITTNVPREILTAKKIGEAYGIRWRIETIFKAWKSHFQLSNVPDPSEVRVKSFIYAMLIFVTLFQIYVFAYLFAELYKREGKHLSLIKLAQFFKEQIWALVPYVCNQRMIERLVEQIFYHCAYESRLQRFNFYEKMESLS